MRSTLPSIALSLLAVAASMPLQAQHYDRQGNVIEGTERPRSLVPPPKAAREKPPEQETPPPAMPRLEGMLPLTVENFHSGTASIDAGSIVVGPDEVVRYVLLTTSDDGRKQTSYEGIRCGPNEWRTYYIGRADGGWIRDVTSRWQPASDGGHSSIRYTLATEYFCDPDGMPWRSAYDIRDRLEGAPSSSVLRRRKDY